MKLAAFLLIAVSMCVGVIGALTAYLAPLSLPDSELVGLTLNAPAGNSSQDLRAPSPVAAKGTELTAELLGTLRDAGVERVKVKEFALERWPEWWVFVLGCFGLGVGAFMVRMANASIASARMASAATSGEARLSPEQTLDASRSEVDALRVRLRGMGSESDRLAAMLEELSRMQQTHIASFLAARAELTSRLGLGGYARLMDAFAAAERAINRAWSAAADEVEAEAITSLDLASELLAEARERV
jgi:hypothetical protein